MARAPLATVAVALAFGLDPTGPAFAQAGASPAAPAFGLPLAGAEAGEFLRAAPVVERRPIGTGVTRPDQLSTGFVSSTRRSS